MKTFQTLPASYAWLMPLCAVIVLLFLGDAVWVASHWQMVHDEPIMHYVVYLTHHGFAPYRDIIDMQMPGSYLTDEFVMRVLGPDKGGEILWDVLNGLAAMAAAVWVAGTNRRWAGLIGGIWAYMWHLRHGEWMLGERDWTVAVLLLISVGCLLQADRSRRRYWFGGAFLFSMAAATIKPPAILITAVCAVVLLASEDRATRRWTDALLWSLAGATVPVVCVVLYLHHFHAMHDFLTSTLQLTRYYASLQRHGPRTLLRMAMLPFEIGLLAFAFFLLNRSWNRREMLVIVAAALCSTLMYFAQGKGFPYHTYPAVTFLMVWLVLEFQIALELSTWRTPLATICLLLMSVLFSFYCLVNEKASYYPVGTLNALQHDIAALNQPSLSGHIQCLDMTLASCLNVSYRLDLVQSTGFISDFYLFPQRPTALTARYQQQFFKEVTSNPPTIIVLSSQTWPGDTNSYQQVSNFPAFENFLTKDYVIRKDFVRGPHDLAAYRLYVHR